MIKLIHLSDLHYRLNWEEDQELVLNNFFIDLEKQLTAFDKKRTFFAFSGDMVLKGSENNLYKEFYNYFDKKLNELGIPKEQRICVPGNHDVSRQYIESKHVEHTGIIKSALDEKEFNDYISNPENLFRSKFDNYNSFEKEFCELGISANLTGQGHLLADNISIYCLNSALCSSGGYNDIDDKNLLSIDTRQLHKWLQTQNSKCKILITHHPLNWLSPWANEELGKIIKNNFTLCLNGHVHDQSYFHQINKEQTIVNCSAPPLLTNKKGQLGYSIITVTELGPIEIQYRQWTKSNSFVTGVNFSDTDDGKVIINKEEVRRATNLLDAITESLEANLQLALKSFSSQPIVWVEPLLSKTNEISTGEDAFNPENLLSTEELVNNPSSYIIKSPPQFGLTCLSHYLIKEAWVKNKSIWLYLDAKTFRSHFMDKAIKEALNKRNLLEIDLKCIILDSWTNNDKDSYKVLKLISEKYSSIPIIVMQTIEENKFLSEPNSENIEREFVSLHLLALSKSHIRKVVAGYNESKHIGEEDAILNKIVTDLEVLNVHRTPLNCLMLLKVCEKYFDENPVNRTKLLEKVLFLLFNMEEIPNYKSKPDLTDCEYVLGYFCEGLIKSEQYLFKKDDFITITKEFCKSNMIGLDVSTVFSILQSNCIIVEREDKYTFRSTYWMYYFGAQRMHHDPEFATFILTNKKYTDFPEIIEFYTGIDRRRKDAIEVILKDLKETVDVVHEKVGLPDGIEPYRSVKWQPTEESLKAIQNMIGDNVKNSSLPESVKDQYSDKHYNPIKPYDQSVHKIFHEYSLVVLLQTVKAASRALRNSDFVDVDLRKQLLQEITRAWEQLSKVLLAIAPVLAQQGAAGFEGISFILLGNFGDTFEQRVNTILDVLPNNVVKMFKNDMFSNKIGPLIFDHINTEKSELKKLELILLIIYERPPEWKINVQKYIVSLSKNSFYLWKVIRALVHEYKYSYASPFTLNEVGFLIKMCYVKHEQGINNPSLDKILKISNTALPKREADGDKND